MEKIKHNLDYIKGFEDAVSIAATWIEEYVLSYVNILNEPVDCPMEVRLSEYCIPSFKEDMMGEIVYKDDDDYQENSMDFDKKYYENKYGNGEE